MGAIKKSIAVFVVMNSAVYIMLTAFFIYSEKQTNYDRLSNQLYYDNILLVYNGGNIDWTKKEYAQQYRVYVEVNPNCRALIKDTSKWTPPMLSGVYPEEVEMASVIGKNVEKMTDRDTQGNQWISFGEQKFRVTGVVGAEYATSCDDLVILFGMQFEEGALEDIPYIVDVETQEGAQEIAESLTTEHPEIRIQQGSIKGTARLTKSAYFYRLLYIELLFITVFSLFIFGKFRHDKYKGNYKVYQICGLPLIYILLKTEIEILITNILSLLTASGVGYFMGLLTGDQLKKLIWITIGITMLSSVLELGFFWQEIMKVSALNRKLKTYGVGINKERS